MELSIIIVNYNVKAFLRECIASVCREINSVRFEIIVVDNNSMDGSAEMIRQNFPEVRLVVNLGNAGFSAANNQGIAIAQGKYILLLNPDTRFADDSFSEIFKFIRSQPDNIFVGLKLLNSDGSLQASAFREHGLGAVFSDLFFWNVFDYPLEEYDSPQEVDSVSGAALLFSKKLTETLGGFDEDLFWSEDIDLCRRVRERGGKVYYFPGTTIVHYGGRSSCLNKKVFYSNYHLSRLKYFRKHRSLFTVAAAELLFLLHAFSRILVLFFLFPFSSGFREQMHAYMFALRKNILYFISPERPLAKKDQFFFQ